MSSDKHYVFVSNYSHSIEAAKLFKGDDFVIKIVSAKSIRGMKVKMVTIFRLETFDTVQRTELFAVLRASKVFG
jgi:hypothetical protein